MAKATVHRAQPEPPPILTITLELSQAEAQLLHDLMGDTYATQSTLGIFGALDSIAELKKRVHTFLNTPIRLKTPETFP